MQIDIVVGAVCALLASAAVKGWSAFRLMNRYQPSEYAQTSEARRLFWLGKITPLTACASILTLAYCTRFPWVIIPAWLFFATIAYGVGTRIHRFLRPIA